jgi:hypothetical protein
VFMLCETLILLIYIKIMNLNKGTFYNEKVTLSPCILVHSSDSFKYKNVWMTVPKLLNVFFIIIIAVNMLLYIINKSY